MDQYKDLVEIKPDTVMNESQWYWIKNDNGSWGGPAAEWSSSHHEKYFKYLKNKNVVITAGANCGMYTRLYSKEFKAVYAFEPTSLNFHCMVLNNQNTNVVKFNCALGDAVRMIAVHGFDETNSGLNEVRRPNDDLSSSYIKTEGTKKTDFIIPMLTIDTFEFPECDLIQLDVQGYELNCLIGAKSTIAQYSPVIILEYGKEDKAIVEYLNGIGYEFKERSGIDDIFVKKEV